MAGQAVVRIAVGQVDVTLVCDDIGYSPDVMDDMRSRAVDTMHELLHMQRCGEEHQAAQDFFAELMGDDDGGS